MRLKTDESEKGIAAGRKDCRRNNARQILAVLLTALIAEIQFFKRDTFKSDGASTGKRCFLKVVLFIEKG